MILGPIGVSNKKSQKYFPGVKMAAGWLSCEPTLATVVP